MNRVEFIGRVREAARAGRAYRVQVADTPPAVGYVGAGDDPVARLAAEVTAVGGQAHVFTDRAAARSALAALISKLGVRSALCWEHPVLERLQVADLLHSLGIKVLTYTNLALQPPEKQRAEMLAAELGITSAAWAVAETGTLVMQSAPGHERLASLLPPVHIALIEAEQILPDLFDLFAQLQTGEPGGLPSNVTLITGPSKTGDIELKLTTGVHGPGEWHVFVIRAS